MSVSRDFNFILDEEKNDVSYVIIIYIFRLII